jgi:hypothetical protein
MRARAVRRRPRYPTSCKYRSCPFRSSASSSRRLRPLSGAPQQVAAAGESPAATPNLLLKHPDETFIKYVIRQMKHLKYASQTLEKKHIKTFKNVITKHMQRPRNTYANICVKHMQYPKNHICNVRRKNKLNNWNRCFQHTCTTWATSRSTFTTSI